jgi:hypothetical protein
MKVWAKKYPFMLLSGYLKVFIKQNPHPFMGWGLKSSEDIFGNFIFYKNFQKINYSPYLFHSSSIYSKYRF